MAGASDVDFWQSRWELGKTGWHAKTVNEYLNANLKDLTLGRDNLRILIPLCGKTLDIKWLLDNGHQVVGTELSKIATEEAFQDVGLTPTVQPLEGVPDAEVYKSDNGKLTIFRGDMFLLTRDVMGSFDAVWDRGALVAIQPDMRERYSKLMTSLLNPDSRYVVECFLFDLPNHKGPPHIIKEETLQQLYGGRCDVTLLQAKESSLDRDLWKVPSFLISYHLIPLR